MSGSPSPQKAASETSERLRLSTSYPLAVSQDAYGDSSTQPSPTDSQPSQGHSSTHEPQPRSHPQGPIEAMTHGYQNPVDSSSRPQSFQPLEPLPRSYQGFPQPSQLPADHHSTPGYPIAGRPPAADPQPYTSPKSQRKTKGHVASACVPCKKAHLRCDAQRPCSRCLNNGKEEACIDVQHKKRGRPRLRDDRDIRYDLSRPPPLQEGPLRRPLSLFPAGTGPGPGEHLAPKYPEQATERESGVYGTSSGNQVSEPVAYLSLEMELSRVSETFVDAVGGLRNNRYLDEVVVPEDREKVLGLKSSILAEQKHLEPNYLPPILGRGDQILQSLGFTHSEVTRFRLNRQDYLTFIGSDGQPRQYLVQLGLAKEGSFFFIVLALLQPPRHAYPPASPQDRNTPQIFHSRAPMASPGLAQQPPGVLSPDISRHRIVESSHLAGRLPPEAGPAMYSSQPQGGPPPYSGPPSRSGYTASGLHQPQPSETGSESQAARSAYQLPPIRVPPEREGSRGARTSRVDIGGLIEKPEGPSRPH